MVQADHVNSGRDTVFNTQVLVHQYQEAKRKVWRQLDSFAYPLDEQNLAYDVNQRFCAQVLGGLHRTFQGQGHVEFTGLLYLGNVVANGETVMAVQLLTHRVDLVGSIRSMLRQMWDPENPARQRLQDEMNEDLIRMQRSFSWTWEILARKEEWTPYRFLYDEAGKRISVKAHGKLPTGISEYPGRVRTTSEALQFIGALQHTHLLHLDLDEAASFYPLLKLTLPLLDNQGPDLDNLRINAEDFEEWDYVNPQADSELKAKHPGLPRT